MSDYKEKLLDVRWQKRRLEILALDGWRCRACTTTEGSFHVHHLWYEKGRDPWDYPDECLISLCSVCHKQAPNYDWKRAFLDLNITERELLEIAIQLHWAKKRGELLTKDLMEKYKTRMTHLYMHYNLFADMTDVDSYYGSDLHNELKKRYDNNG